MTALAVLPYAVAVAGIVAIAVLAVVMAAKASGRRRPVPPDAADPLDILNNLTPSQAGPRPEAFQAFGPGVAPRPLPAGASAATLLVRAAAGSAQAALIRFPDENSARACWKRLAADLESAWPVRRRRFANHAGRTVFVEGSFDTPPGSLGTPGLELSAWSSGRWLVAVWAQRSEEDRGELVAPVRDRLRAFIHGLHAESGKG